MHTYSYSEAVRLVHSKWAELHQEFKAIESIGNNPTPSLQSTSEITLEAMQSIVEQISMRSRVYHSDPVYKPRVLRKLDSDEDIVRLAISSGNYEGLKASAKSWLKGWTSPASIDISFPQT